MRNGIGKPLEFSVLGFEFIDQALPFGFRPGPQGYISYHRNHKVRSCRCYSCLKGSHLSLDMQLVFKCAELTRLQRTCDRKSSLIGKSWQNLCNGLPKKFLRRKEWLIGSR